MISNVVFADFLESMKAIGYSYNHMDYDSAKASRIANSLVKNEINSGHLNFLSGIHVGMDVRASIKWWQQAERYHFFNIIMSQSVMHSIAKLKPEEVTKDLFADGTSNTIIDGFKTVLATYRAGGLDRVQLIYSVPVGLLETARVSTNYLQLFNMINQRSNHPLPEWGQFIEELFTKCPGLKLFWELHSNKQS